LQGTIQNTTTRYNAKILVTGNNTKIPVTGDKKYTILGTIQKYSNYMEQYK